MKPTLFTLILLLSSNLFYSQEDNLFLYPVPFFKSGKELIHSHTGGFKTPNVNVFDLNNDGIDDLLLIDKVDGYIIPFIQNEHNEFNFSPEFIKTFIGKFINWTVFTDWNCDDVIDLISYNDAKSLRAYLGAYENNKYVLADEFKIIDIEIDSLNIVFDLIDRPVVVDVDFDGDKDILSFYGVQTQLGFFKNLAIENGDCEETSFVLESDCWGEFESSVNIDSLTLFADCEELQNEVNHDRNGEVHFIPNLFALDFHNDLDIDLFYGQSGGTELNLMINGKEKYNRDVIANLVFKIPNEVPVDIIKPMPYYYDINNDKVNDLIISKGQSSSVFEQEKILWVYENVGTNVEPDFNFVANDFLISDCVNVGVLSMPKYIDWNRDGLLDILISNNGRDLDGDFDSNSHLTYFENTGSLNEPKYELINQDLFNLKDLDFSALSFTYGDLNGDKLIDAIAGEAKGSLLYFENSGSGLEFKCKIEEYDLGSFTKPCLFDFDNDSDLDIISGEATGNLNYLENISEGDGLTFDLKSEFFGRIDVRMEVPATESVPTIYETSDGVDLYVATGQGRIFQYKNIDQYADPDSEFLIETDHYGNQYLGIRQINIDIADINDDNELDFIIGSSRGGVQVFSTVEFELNPVAASVVLHDEELTLFPNPCGETINLNNIDENSNLVSICNIQGQLVLEKSLDGSHGNNMDLKLNGLGAGVYIVTVLNKGQRTTKKFVKK